MNVNITKVRGGLISTGESVLPSENPKFHSYFEENNEQNSVATQDISSFGSEVILWLLIWITLFVGFTVSTCYIGNTWKDTSTRWSKRKQRENFKRENLEEIFIVSTDTQNSDNQLAQSSRDSSNLETTRFSRNCRKYSSQSHLDIVN